MSNKGAIVGLGVLLAAVGLGYLFLGKRQVSNVVGLGTPNENVPNGENPGAGVPVDLTGGPIDPYAQFKITNFTPTLENFVSGLGFVAKNPWTNPSSLETWSGISGDQPLTRAALSGAGYEYMDSYSEWLAKYPNAKAPMSEADYYIKKGAYELAARTDPQKAFGAQQARAALSGGEITPAQYKSAKDQGFVDETGNPIVSRKPSIYGHAIIPGVGAGVGGEGANVIYGGKDTSGNDIVYLKTW